MTAAPDVQFVLDHLGKPPIKDGDFQPWADDLARLAERPNVVAKLSGLVTEADLDDWTSDDLRPYVHHALNVFGTDRTMFASDWPPVTLGSSYDEWFRVARSVAELSDSEEQAVFRSNAIRVYGLPDGIALA